MTPNHIAVTIALDCEDEIDGQKMLGAPVVDTEGHLAGMVMGKSSRIRINTATNQPMEDKTCATPPRSRISVSCSASVPHPVHPEQIRLRPRVDRRSHQDHQAVAGTHDVLLQEKLVDAVDDLLVKVAGVLQDVRLDAPQ